MLEERRPVYERLAAFTVPADDLAPEEITDEIAAWLDKGAPDKGAPDKGAPDKGAPDKGAPDKGAPDKGAPDEGAPGHGATAGPDGAPE
jgi:hypothetical protein